MRIRAHVSHFSKAERRVLSEKLKKTKGTREKKCGNALFMKLPIQMRLRKNSLPLDHSYERNFLAGIFVFWNRTSSVLTTAHFHFSGDTMSTMHRDAHSVQPTNLQLARIRTRGRICARGFISSGAVVYSNTRRACARPSFRRLNFRPFRRTACALYAIARIFMRPNGNSFTISKYRADF